MQLPDFDHPLGVLREDHRRILLYLDRMTDLSARRRGERLGGEEQTLLSAALRYFRERAPLHSEDEEESLFPRLRRTDAMWNRMDSLEQDHQCADGAHGELDRLGGLWQKAGSLSPADASRFDVVVRQLHVLYRHHIGVENDVLFPYAAAQLTSAELSAIGREMAARRGTR
jgi:iron-sulfur cluster repair protein YtfE (RIC family)